MPNQGARRGWEQSQSMSGLGGERQRQVGVAATRRMVMDANTIETCVLAAGDERGQLGQGSTDRNAKGEVNPGHSTSFFTWRARRHGDMLQTQCLNLVHTRKGRFPEQRRWPAVRAPVAAR